MGKKPVTGVDICTLSNTYQFSEEKKNIINLEKKLLWLNKVYIMVFKC